MNKKIIILLLIAIFLIHCLNTSAVNLKNFNDTNDFLSNPDDFILKIRNEYNIRESSIQGYDSTIDPIYCKIWENPEFDASSTRGFAYDNNGYCYVMTSLADLDGMIRVNEHIGILKYDLSDGSLVKEILLESNQNPSAAGITFHNGHIYIVGEYPSFIAKLDTNLNIIKVTTLENFYFQPRDVLSDNTGIYIAGDVYNPDSDDFDVFLIKFNSNCELVWEDIVYWDYQDETMSGYTVNNGNIYLTGSTRIKNPDETFTWWSFILKYDSNGNLLKQLIGEELETGFSIKIANGKIFVGYGVVTPADNIMGYVYDLKVSAYNSDFETEPIWSYVFDQSMLDMGFDVIIVNGQVFLLGTTIDIVGMDAYMRPFLIKINGQNGNEIWAKDFTGLCIPDDIQVIGNEIVLCGEAISEMHQYGMFMKCDDQGGDGSDLFVSPYFVSLGEVKQGASKSSSFKLKNNGAETISWNVKSFPEWVVMNPVEGNLDPNEDVKITVSLRSAGMVVDFHTGVIEIESDGGNEKIDVALNLIQKQSKSNLFLSRVAELFPFIQKLIQIPIIEKILS